MTYKIENGVEKPLRGRRSAYPFAELKPGQSFFVPLEDSGTDLIKTLQARLSAAARRRQEIDTKAKFSVHRTEKNGKVGVGVWRDS